MPFQRRDTGRYAPRGSPRASEQRLKDFGDTLGNAQRIFGDLLSNDQRDRHSSLSLVWYVDHIKAMIHCCLQHFYVAFLIFSFKKQKPAASREILRKCPNLCRDTLGNAPKSSWRPFQEYLKCIGNSLGNARWPAQSPLALLFSSWRRT
jgi:hypothetical protein